MSYADTDPKLSDRAVYSNFFRTIPSDSNYNPSHLALVRRFNWTRVGTIYQDTDKYSIVSRQLVKVGEYRKSSDSLVLHSKKIIWKGKGPPRDRNLVRLEMQRVSVPVYSCICVLAALGIIMASIFLVINIIFRDHRYIKMSSPNMNNIIIVGCMLSYISIFLLGTDGGVVSKEYVKYVCAGRSWVLAIGFSLSFGAMFSKTWRVHAIFTNIKLNKKIIKDYKLFLLVCVLVIIDACILGTWQIVDPLGRDERNLTSQVVGDHEVVAVIEYCTSDFMEIWLGIIYAYKGLLLILGCFLAWETRRVSIPALNDSKYIGMSVYNVVIMCICGAAISFIISDQPNPSFIIISLFIIFSTTVTLCLVFVPKVIELKRDPNGEERRIRATLRKKKKKKDDQHQTLKQKMKDLAAENERFKEIIQQKAEEIRSLLEQLGDDADDIDSALKPCLHKKIMELRVSDMSPSRASRASSVSEVDNTSTYSETSAFTSTWAMESPRVRQRTHLHSTKSMASTDTNNTDTTDFLDTTRYLSLYIGVWGCLYQHMGFGVPLRQRTYLHFTKSMASIDTNNIDTRDFLGTTRYYHYIGVWGKKVIHNWNV
ncbi:hypothetical protein FSP39_007438 [Pinctada imbricata]|uniref:G-protein coupled receptors family 3 profile domain-containing protein n=1 Tax=Pinctada imbricata TaxID=66713 RepID=A0AA88YLE1_PINIB|nr:hypothetical protein FSP39_007438 [Pinctada imbricata]